MNLTKYIQKEIVTTLKTDIELSKSNTLNNGLTKVPKGTVVRVKRSSDQIQYVVSEFISGYFTY